MKPKYVKNKSNTITVRGIAKHRAKGRARTKQIQSMSPKERKEDKQNKLESNRLAAKYYREKNKRERYELQNANKILSEKNKLNNELIIKLENNIDYLLNKLEIAKEQIVILETLNF